MSLLGLPFHLEAVRWTWSKPKPTESTAESLFFKSSYVVVVVNAMIIRPSRKKSGGVQVKVSFRPALVEHDVSSALAWRVNHLSIDYPEYPPLYLFIFKRTSKHNIQQATYLFGEGGSQVWAPNRHKCLYLGISNSDFCSHCSSSFGHFSHPQASLAPVTYSTSSASIFHHSTAPSDDDVSVFLQR